MIFIINEEKFEFTHEFPIKYHSEDFLTSKQAVYRIKKVYQHVMFTVVNTLPALGIVPILPELPSTSPVIITGVEKTDKQTTIDVNSPQNRVIYQLAMDHQNGEISKTQVDEKLLSLSGGGSSLQMAIAFFVYYLNRN